MRAIWYERSGPAAEVLTPGEMPDLEPGPGEVRVRLALSAMNPTDVKRRERGRELDRFARIIPHNDGAGMIDWVGEGVPEARQGERVWIFGAQAGRPFGTAAQFVVVPARQAIRLPDAATFEDGACLGVPAVTAHRCLFADGGIEGATVVVSGGTGRVGAYAIQLAKRAGATVIATVGSAEKADQAKALGADHALCYRRDDLAAALAEITGGRGVDRVVEVEFGSNVGWTAKALKSNGSIATYASMADTKPRIPFYALMYKNIAVRFVAIFDMPRAAQDEAFADITACLAGGALRHRIGLRCAFAEVVRAHEALEANAVDGCALLEIPS